MSEIEPGDQSLKSLKGLHLWHAPLSSCSQRVRIVLEEMGKGYESHLVNLKKDEHASAAYQAIHPKGLVPALVDDGRLFIESIDIIQHVAADGPELMRLESPELLRMADEAQMDLKLLTFEFLFRAEPPPPPQQAEAFQKSHNNAWLRQFRKDFEAGFDHDRLDSAVRRIDAGFSHLDGLLADGREFLTGDQFSLADVAWMPNVHRFALMDWPFDRTPNLAAWFERVSSRPSYKNALLAWQDERAASTFADYTKTRQADGTDVRTFGGLSG